MPHAAGAHNCSFEQNFVFNYEQLVEVYNCADVTVNGNFMNNTEYDEYPNNVVIFQSSERVKFRENIFTDNYKWFDFGVSQVDCANNTIAGNGIISDLTGVQIPTPLSISPPSPLHTAQSTSTIMGLTSISNSQVVNNHIYQPGGLIPGFEPIPLLAVVGTLGVILTITVQKRRKLK